MLSDLNYYHHVYWGNVTEPISNINQSQPSECCQYQFVRGQKIN